MKSILAQHSTTVTPSVTTAGDVTVESFCKNNNNIDDDDDNMAHIKLMSSGGSSIPSLTPGKISSI